MSAKKTYKSKEIDMKKFTNYDRALEYVNNLGYSYNCRHCFKEDRSEVWKHKSKKKYAFIKSTFDYLNSDTLDMGTVWQVSLFGNR